MSKAKAKGPFVSLTRLRSQDVNQLVSDLKIDLKGQEDDSTNPPDNDLLAVPGTSTGNGSHPGDGKKEYHCHKCNLTLPSREILATHMKGHVSGRRSRASSVDDNKIAVVASTSAAASGSSNCNSFPCCVCGKVFVQSNLLKLHERTHNPSDTRRQTDEKIRDNKQTEDDSMEKADFFKIMKSVIQDTALKCFADAMETNSMPSSPDETLQRVRECARKALEQYCRDKEGFGDVKESENEDDTVLIESQQENVCKRDKEESKSDTDIKIEDERKTNVSPTISEDSASTVENPLTREYEVGNKEDKSPEKNNLNLSNASEKSASTMNDSGATTSSGMNSSSAEDSFASSPDKEQTVVQQELTTYQQLMMRKSRKLFSCPTCHKRFALQSHLKLHQSNVHANKKEKKNKKKSKTKDGRKASPPPPPPPPHPPPPSRAKVNEVVPTPPPPPTTPPTPVTPPPTTPPPTTPPPTATPPTATPPPNTPPPNTPPSQAASPEPPIDQAVLEDALKMVAGTKYYQCNVEGCRKWYRRERNFCLHYRAHKKGGPFNCSLCGKVFPAEILLKQHEKIHSDKRMYQCSMCEKSYDFDMDLSSHYTREHAKMASVADTNNLPIETPSTSMETGVLSPTKVLSNGPSAAIPPPSLKCVQCNVQLVSRSSYEHHLKTVHSPNVSSVPRRSSTFVKCWKCNVQFLDEEGLKKHVEANHPSSLLSCPKCNVTFTNDTSLDRHVVNCQVVSTHLKCSMCDLYFADSNLLQFHTRQHLLQNKRMLSPGPGGLKCTKCRMILPNIKEFQLHMELKHPTPYACQTCGEKFSNKTVLAKHVKYSHTSQLSKKYLYCVFCGMKFFHGIALNSHMKQHSLAKSDENSSSLAQSPSTSRESPERVSSEPVKMVSRCSKCNAQFPDATSLNTHVIRAHSSVSITKAVYKCPQCNQVFINDDVFQSHRKDCRSPDTISRRPSSIEKGESPGRKGGKTSTSPAGRKQRSPLQSSQANIVCSICSIQFSDHDSLQEHVKTIHSSTTRSRKKTKSPLQNIATDVDVSSPKVNPKVVRSKSPRSMAKINVVKCSQCSLTFEDNATLQKHTQDVHPSESSVTLKCLRCNKQFPTMSQFRSHVRLHRKLVCPFCGKSFTVRSHFIKHMSSHSDKESFKCDKCHSQFNSNAQLIAHMKQHQAQDVNNTAVNDTSPDFSENFNVPKRPRGRPRVIFPMYPAVGYSSSVVSNIVEKNASLQTSSAGDVNMIDDEVVVLSDDDSENKENLYDDDVEIVNSEDDVVIVSDDIDGTNRTRVDGASRSIDLTKEVESDIPSPNDSNCITNTSVRNDGIELNSPKKSSVMPKKHNILSRCGTSPPEIAGGNTHSSFIPEPSTSNMEPEDYTDVVNKIIDSLSDTPDSLEDIIREERTARGEIPPSLTPQPAKKILKDSTVKSQLNRKRRVSFAEEVAVDRNSDNSPVRTMPKLTPEMPIVSPSKVKSAAPPSRTKITKRKLNYPPLVKDCYISLTKLDDALLPRMTTTTAPDKKLSSEARLENSSENSKPHNLGNKSKNKDRNVQKNKLNSKSPPALLEFNEQNNAPKGGPASSEHAEKLGEKQGPVVKRIKVDDSKSPTPAASISNKLKGKKSTPRAVLKNIGEDSVAKDEAISTSAPVATSTPFRNVEGRRNASKEGDSPTKDTKASSKNVSCQPQVSAKNLSGGSITEKEVLDEVINSRAYLRGKKDVPSEEGKFVCKVCGKVFQYLPHFRAHKKTHAGKVSHKCPFCNEHFPLRFLLGLHIADHFEKGTPRINSENADESASAMQGENISGTESGKKSTSEYRIPKKTGGAIVKNDSKKITGSAQKSKRSTQDISVDTAEERPESVQAVLTSHEGEVSNSARESEDDGQHDFNDNSSYDNEDLGDPRTQDENFGVACKKCDKTFSQVLKLKMHESIHSGIGLYQCSVCEMVFHYRSSWVAHKGSHTGEYKFECKFCGKKSNDEQMMVTHRSRHESGCRPFKCDQCSKHFAKEATLLTHMRLHSQKNKYRCHICNWTFNNRIYFASHLMSHSGKRPFVCKVCKLSFNRIDACRNHIKCVHVSKKEIKLKKKETLMDYVRINENENKEMEKFAEDAIKKTQRLRTVKAPEAVTDGETSTASGGNASTRETSNVADSELPEPVLINPKRLLHEPIYQRYEKAKANLTLSGLFSEDMDSKERRKKLCIETRSVLARMKAFPQVPTRETRRSRVRTPARTRSASQGREIPDKTPREERMRRSQSLSSLSGYKIPLVKTYDIANSGNLPVRTLMKDNIQAVLKSDKVSDLGQNSKMTLQLYNATFSRKLGRPCKHCGKYYSEKYLKQHELSHSGVGKISCSFCDKSFTHKTGLRYHLATHADTRPYSCDICKQTFKLKHHVNAHKRIHMAEKKFTCKMCKMPFSKKTYLRNHILTHMDTKDRPYMCYLCGRKFVMRNHLSRHITRHLGVKPFECEVCQRKFGDKYSKDRHVRLRHSSRNHAPRPKAKV